MEGLLACELIIGAKLKVHLLGTVRWLGLVWLVSELAPKTEIGHLLGTVK